MSSQVLYMTVYKSKIIIGFIWRKVKSVHQRFTLRQKYYQKLKELNNDEVNEIVDAIIKSE